MVRTPLLTALSLVCAAALISCSEDDPPAANPTTATVLATPRQVPTSTRPTPTGPTVTPSPFPTPILPRTDCPPSWAPYTDPEGYFSFCYPKHLKIVVEERAPGQAVGTSVGVYPVPALPDGHHFVSFVRRDQNRFPCFQDFYYTEMTMGTLIISGRAVETCTTDTYLEPEKGQLHHRTLRAQVPTSVGQVIEVTLSASGDPIAVGEAAAYAILQTLIVR